MRVLHSLLFFLSLTLFACGEAPAPVPPPAKTPPPATAKKVRIGLIMKTLTNPYFIKMEKGARKAETELGIELIVRTGTQETSFEHQVAIVDDLVEKRLVDALVLTPADSWHLIASVKKAREAGIPVVNVSTRLDPKALAEIGCQNIPLVSVNNEQGAYLSAKALVADVKTPSKAMILEGIRQADSAEQRKQGARRAFAENPAVSLVASETANWKIDEAYDVTKKTLLAHPDISLVFAANDMMALGAVKYLRDAEKKNVKVAGFDALTEALQAIKAREMVATLDQQGDEQGYQGVQYAVRLLKGETLPAETLLEVKLITADNVP